MNLKIETVTKAYSEFGEAFGWPNHAKAVEQRKRIVQLNHRELSKFFTEESFPSGLTIAWKQARKFPLVSDFFVGFATAADKPKEIR